ncbi:MAG: hypothetical protein MI919_12875, partial [Holophagales bacterium]|nr:hypothetical protein [Holophagales bacterium]
AAALRLAVAAQLAAADLLPRGAPPSAVLVVRRLVDPLPGHIRRRPGVPGVDPKWERAIRGRLDRLYAAAASPAEGPVPAAAEAVRFRDEAELLACLLGESREEARGRWYWRALARGRPDLQSWLDGGRLGPLLAESARPLPAALARLPRARAVAVAGCLGDGDARRVARALVAEHELDPGAWAGALARREEHPARGSETGRAALAVDTRAGEGRTPAGTGDVGTTAVMAPWRRWLSSAEAAPLRPLQELCLGLALGLRLEPARVRGLRFVADVVRALAARSGAPASPSAGGPGPGSPSRLASGGRQGIAPSPEVEPGTASGAVGPSVSEPATRSGGRVGASTEPPGTGGPPELRMPAGMDAAATDPPGSRPPRSAEGIPGPGTQPVEGGLPASADPRAGPAVAETIARARLAEASGGLDLGEGVSTGLGGALFLINLLGVVGTFAGEEAEQPWALPADLGPWAAIEILARAFSGTSAAPGGDALWTALAQLDGREPGQPVPATAHAWLARASGPLNRRLVGLLEWQGAEKEAGPYLLELPGTLFVTATHVDLVASLEAVRLDVRRAGLDLDPGWVPELGRVVQFHYR